MSDLHAQTDQDPHAMDAPAAQLLEGVRASREGSTLQQATAGFKLAMGSVRYLSKTPALWPSAAIPAVITSALFFVSAGLGLYFSGDIFEWIWSKPLNWLAFLWWIGRVLFAVLSVAVGYMVAVVLGSIFAGPFNDILSQRIERRVQGRAHLGADDLKANIRGIIRGTLHSLGNLAAMVVFMTPVMLLNLIPGVGSLAASAIGLVVSSHFLAFEFMDWSLERRNYGWREKWGRVLEERPVALGFGLGTSLLLWIPVINFAAMPVAVIGGTVLALELDSRRSS